MILRYHIFLHTLALILADDQSSLQNSLQLYAPKGCKYNPIPSFLGTRAFTAYTGEVHVNDVFGLPSTAKRHILQLTVNTESLLTLQAEVHRDTPATLTVDAYRRGEAGKPSARVLAGRNLLGCGGDDTKAFLHGVLGDKDLEIDLVFELISVEVAASQVDSRVAEARCWPVRLDIAAIPTSRAALHWPVSCPTANRLPGSFQGTSNQVSVLGDKGLSLEPDSSRHFVYRFGGERPWNDFERSLWAGTIEVPPRLHRFVRLFLRTNFRFASSPLQLAIELFDLKDTPDATALAPKCAMGCLGGVPVHSGQVIDHAMPTGFRYKVWLLAASLPEWTRAVPVTSRHCIEFDFDYSIRYEERMTPFEVGPAAWLCESSRLPAKIVQTPRPWSTDKLSSTDQLVAGRSIWVRDRFGFPPDEVADMEHKIEIEVSEPCVFRATTHHSDGVDVFIALTRKDETQRACKTFKHPGPVPRQTIFCILQPGTFTLTFFADYPLGGLHPCSDFFAQIALRPTALANEDKTKQCVAAASDLSSLQVQRSLALTTTPQWKSIKVPISFENTPATVSVWSSGVTITEEDASQRLFLRLVLHSDYISSDLRFQVRFEGKYIADTQVTSHGYADMIGPLDPGTYYVDMYYVTGTKGPANTKLCSTSMVDLRLVSRSSYGKGNSTAQWLCTSTRVPPPDLLSPQPDEQVLIDSEYVVPDNGAHRLRIKVEEPRLVRVKTSSSDAEFQLELWTRGSSEALVARGMDSLEVLVGKGLFALKLIAASSGERSTSACQTFVLNLLLQPQQALPLCPWSPSSSDQSAAAQAQKNADDHIGNVLLDLVPQKLTKELNVKPPVMLWMSQGMSKTFDMSVDSTSAIRIDVSVQPPFLPLEINLLRKRASGKLEPPIASAEWTEGRLLLMQSDVPKGTYILEFLQPRKYSLQPGGMFSDDALANLCAHVTIHAEVGVASKEAVNTLRSELLDLPDLLAVQPLPPSLNTVGWFSSSLAPVVGTQVYRFKDGVGKITVKVDDPAILRMVCEPADLSNADIDAELVKDSATVAQADHLGQLVAEVQPGSYQMVLHPKANSPFLVTVGIATQSRLKEDYALADSGKACLDKFPVLASGVTFSPRGWTIGPKFIRLQPSFLGTEGLLGKVPVELKAASVLYIEAGSAMPLDLVRIALTVPEGLWVGEQRGSRNSLEIELPPGKYEVQASQPKPMRMDKIQRCLDFSVRIIATPLNPDATSDTAEAADAAAATDGQVSTGDEGKKLELAAREDAAVEAAPCFAMGTVPLPLDLSDPKGGSKILGGPLDQDGRLLVRTRAMLTDMHDGRKKVFLDTKGKKLQLKIGVIMGGHARFSRASQLAFGLQPVGSISMIEPVETWSTPDGWERVYRLDQNGYWLSFHHAHRERSESACVHFGLELEIHPVDDSQRMTTCSGSSSSPEEIFPSSLDLGQTAQSQKTFRYKKTISNLQQRQKGFLTTTKFTLASTSYVIAEVGYNFFTSHAEMDIVLDSAGSKQTSLVTAERDFLHAPNEPLNSMLVLGHKLLPGDYMLRIADDHYSNQVGDSSACFPFSFEFRAVPAMAPPTVVSVKPHPSVPIARGVDLVLTLRFSEPPAGTLSDVVGAISLGGVQATTGGSMNAMSDKFVAKKTSVVQVSSAEGHLVWVIGWSAQSIAQMRRDPQLKLGLLRSNKTKQKFYFNPPTYTVVDAPGGSPWKGGLVDQRSSSSTGDTGSATSALAADSSASSGSVSQARAEGGATSAGSAGGSDVGAPRPEGSAKPLGGSDGTGEVRVEGTAKQLSAGGGKVGQVRSDSYQRTEEQEAEEEEGHAPRVQEWNPMDQAEASTRPRVSSPASGESNRPSASSPSSSGDYSPLDSSSEDCPDGTVRSAATGVCEALGGTSWPVGYRTIVIGCGVTLSVFLVAFFWPRLRNVGMKGGAASRFKDIGSRTSAEELGLVQAADNWDDDDDML